MKEIKVVHTHSFFKDAAILISVYVAPEMIVRVKATNCEIFVVKVEKVSWEDKLCLWWLIN